MTTDDWISVAIWFALVGYAAWTILSDDRRDRDDDDGKG